MKAIAVNEFKARCLAILEDVARTGESVVVSKHGRVQVSSIGPLASRLHVRASG
jgi:antitoxin (DNA-binding transcriptional repressor) of toxin-antitoxin stability system